MTKKGVERQSNIEILRIFAIIGVIILHYNNPLMGGAISYVNEGSINFYVLYVLESIFACAVDLFMLISGYFLCDSGKRNLWRPIELILQVIIFGEVIYLIRVVVGVTTFSLKTLVLTLVPSNYFAILYSVVFIISPFINILVNNLSKKNFRILIYLSMGLFSFYPTVVDVLGECCGRQFIGLSTIGMYGSQWGYSIVNFTLMYLIGSYLKRTNCRIHNWVTCKLLFVFVINVLVITTWARVNDIIGYATERSAWEYCNPLIIYESIIIFSLFCRMKLGINMMINVLSECVFTVFLLHSVFIPYLCIQKYVAANVFIMLLHLFGCAIIIYLICFCVHKIYHWIVDPIFKKIKSFISITIDI